VAIGVIQLIARHPGPALLIAAAAFLLWRYIKWLKG
jgi:hypothetical protein